MDRIDELKAKARELERSDQPRSALEVYLRLARETDSQSTGALWARIGDLQLHLGDPASAQESYSRAIELFGGAGQGNNAIAIALRRIAANGADPLAHLTLGEISLKSGYRDYARQGLAGYARHIAQQGRAAEVIGAFNAFLDRFPDETRLWREWVAEMLELGRKSDAIDALRQVWEHLSDRGADGAAAEVREALIDIDPAADPAPAARRPPVRSAPAPAAAEPSPEGLPLLGYELPSAPPERIAPIEGLEPTRADLGWGDAEESSTTADSLPLIAPSEPERGTLLDQEDADDDDELPLLGVLPGLDTGGGYAGSDERGRASQIPPFQGDIGEDLPLIAQPISELAEGETAPEEGVAGLAAVIDRIRSATGRQVELSDASTHYDLGLAYKEMGLADESLAHLAGALEEGHDPVAVIEVVGELLVERGDHLEARAILSEAMALGDPGDPSFLGIHYWLARCEEALGDETSARDRFERVVKVDPDFRDTRSRLDSSGF